MIDLHTHSKSSDGSLSPAALMNLASRQGLTAIALTDHDTIAGLDEAGKEAEKLGLRFIPGVEINVTWEPGEFHLLGLGIHCPSPGFLEALTELVSFREARNQEIIERMRKADIAVGYEDMASFSGGCFIGRPHFAALLINRGIVKNQEQAFRRYLGKGRPFYVPKAGLEFSRAVSIIRNSGGITVLAHPMSLYAAWGRLPDLVKDFRDQGLDGIEAWHPTAKVHTCKRLEALGKSLGLFITAGSDFHGESRPDRKLGVTAGGQKIDDSLLEAIPNLIITK
ncbi:MAG: PHP domain-containing protein [Treponema sp.]|jgi:predicted metal-dependent phosphoesterase TrpH|nr:PHP domain-containing protein [Treponema sp.]